MGSTLVARRAGRYIATNATAAAPIKPSPKPTSTNRNPELTSEPGSSRVSVAEG